METQEREGDNSTGGGIGEDSRKKEEVVEEEID